MQQEPSRRTALLPAARVAAKHVQKKPSTMLLLPTTRGGWGMRRNGALTGSYDFADCFF